MLLTVDIGNTNINLGVFDDKTIVKSWNLSSDKNRTDDEYGVMLRSLASVKIDAAVISSVVLSLTGTIKSAIEKYLEVPVFVVSSKTQTGIALDVENPGEVGCDRIANACAAYAFYKCPAVVVDFGTATNFDVVTADGRFIGGIIAPGLKMSAESFSSSTNLLPKLNIEGINSVIGRNTVTNMLSGVVVGHAAMIEGLIERMEGELRYPVATIATGGFSPIITGHMKREFDYFDRHLTLKGLRVIYERVSAGVI